MKKNSLLIVLVSLIVLVVMSLVLIISQKKDNDDNDNKQVIAYTGMNIEKQETQKEIIYSIIDYDNKQSYSWVFTKEDKNGSLKDSLIIDMSLKLNILTDTKNDLIESMVDNKDKLVIEFEHHGQLPSRAKISLDVSDKYENGKILYLYYLNEEKHQIEYVDNGLIVKNGKITFEIDHCSNYFLTASIVQDAVNNPKNVNLIIIAMVVVVIVLIATTLFQNKDK